jgi:hypothetical protein
MYSRISNTLDSALCVTIVNFDACTLGARQFSSFASWKTSVGSQVELGRQRLPALRLPDSVANARRHKARRNRDRRLNNNEECFQLLGWNIFITNVPHDAYALSESGLTQ